MPFEKSNGKLNLWRLLFFNFLNVFTCLQKINGKISTKAGDKMRKKKQLHGFTYQEKRMKVGISVHNSEMVWHKIPQIPLVYVNINKQNTKHTIRKQ